MVEDGLSQYSPVLGVDPEQGDLRIVLAFGEPCLHGLGPLLVDLGLVAHDLGLAGHRHVGLARRVGVAKVDLVVARDLRGLGGDRSG